MMKTIKTYAAILLALLFAMTSMTGIVSAQEKEKTETEVTEDVQYVMFLGTNDMDTNLPVFEQGEAREKAKEILIRHFGGYTIQDAEGGWMDGDILYQEYTIVIYLSDTTMDEVHAAADELIETFHQSSILIQTYPTTTEFYSREDRQGSADTNG